MSAATMNGRGTGAAILGFLRVVLQTLQLVLMRVGVGWMFALLTFNFNRIAITEFNAVAVVVTALIGLHHFISFFQVYWGRIADRFPLFGFRRTPYFLISNVGTALVFLALPTLVQGLGVDSGWTLEAVAASFGLIFIFGVLMAMNGSAANSLMAEVTEPKRRGMIVAIVWASIILSGIVSAIVAGAMMPVYSPEAMQSIYNLTPWIALITGVLGVAGLEKRLSKAQLAEAAAKDPNEASPLETLRVTRDLVKRNPQVRGFFAFVLLAIMGIFLQDAILEPFGGTVFGMTPGETSKFQASWGGGALGGMVLIGAISAIFPLPKKFIASLGGLAIALSLGLLAVAALTLQQTLITPGLVLMGVGVGAFNVGALSMMMEMTVEGQTGLYMGMWGMAQGLGTGLANLFSGLGVTLLVQSQLFSAANGYALLFVFEALVMIAAVGILRSISVQEFKGLSRADVGRALAMETGN